MADPEDRSIVAFLHESGHLKRTPRAGWLIAGVPAPESVAEHSYRTAVIGYVLALMEGANPERTATLCVFHDLPETRIGDVPSVGKRYVATAPAGEVVKDQTAELPHTIGEAVRQIIGEHEARVTLEAQCARDADKVECLLQAREYQAQGYTDVQPWVDTMLAAVRTRSGRRLAAAALESKPSDWWYEIAAGYGTDPSNGGS